MVHLKRPMILNGINQIATRHDLHRPSIILYLPVIGKGQRKPEQELVDQLEEVRPALLGCLCDAVSAGLKNRDMMYGENLPRMADFARWVMACEEGLPWNEGEFLKAYYRNRYGVVEEATDPNPVCAAIKALMENRESWQGTPSELLTELNWVYGESAKGERQWPKVASQLSKALNESTAFLREIGLEVSRPPRAKQRVIAIRRIYDDIFDGDDDVLKGLSFSEPLPHGGAVDGDSNVSGYLFGEGI